MATIIGTAGNDVIVGTPLSDLLMGDDGADRINGDAGDDNIQGGLGNDYLYGDAGADLIFGNAGNDTIVGDAGSDLIHGNDGIDGIFGGGGNDTILGEAGQDTIYGDGDNDILDGGAEDDKIYGGNGNDRIYGGTGNDLVDGQTGDDTLVYHYGSGVDQMLGNTGLDTVELVLTSAQLALVKQELVAFADWLDAQYAAVGGVVSVLTGQASGPVFTFASMGLTVSAVEVLKVLVDGSVIDINSLRNSAPVAVAEQSVATAEDNAVSGNIGATDPDGDALNHVVTTGPQHGNVSLNATTGAFVYTPDANFWGEDSFEVVVSDPSGLSAVQTVTISVSSVADAPVVDASQSLTTDEDEAVSGVVVATDADGDALNHVVSNGPQHGQVSLDAQTGAFVYTPDANFWGDDSFEVVVSDASGLSVVQTVSISVSSVADAPVVDASQSLTTDEDVAVSGVVVATDADRDALNHVVTTGPQHGVVNLNATTGAFVYTPIGNFSGDDSFEVVISDPSGETAVQVVNISVGAVADAPVLTVGEASVSVEGATIDGTDEVDVLYGTAGADLIIGNAGDDIIYSDGGAGGYLVGLSVDASLVDVDGSETLSISIAGVPAGAVLSAGTKNADGTWTLAPADLTGLTMTVGAAVDVTLTVTATASEANGSIATTTAEISVSFEGIEGAGADILRGGAGNDQFFGGEGLDFVDYSTVGNRVYVNLYSGVAFGEGTDKISGVEGVIGSGFADILIGNNQDNVVYAGGGNDVVRTLGGDDLVFDGAGMDAVFSGLGDDTIVADGGNTRDRYHGGWGRDAVDYSAATGALSVDLGNGQVHGAAGHDLLFSIESVTAGSGNDTLLGSNWADAFDGGAGDDVLQGGRGADQLTGGLGNDRFVFARNDVLNGQTALAFDTITDFSEGDVLDFSGLGQGRSGIDLGRSVHLTDSDAGTMVSVNMGGSVGFVDIVLLQDVHDVSLNQMISDGHFIV